MYVSLEILLHHYLGKKLEKLCETMEVRVLVSSRK